MLCGYIWVIFGKIWNAKKEIGKKRVTWEIGPCTPNVDIKLNKNRILVILYKFSHLNYDLEFGMTIFPFATTNKIRWVEIFEFNGYKHMWRLEFEVGFKSHDLIFIFYCVNVTLARSRLDLYMSSNVGSDHCRRLYYMCQSTMMI